jgi:hypothetical protein
MEHESTQGTLDTVPGKRRSRLRPLTTNKRLQITDRDVEILRLLSRYRYLRSHHLHTLIGGKSHKRFIERLGDLYHEGGYVNRPPQQWQAINARYMPAVYELGEAGERLLIDQGMLNADLAPLQRQGRHGAVRQFHHDLMICDILASIEIGVLADKSLRLVSSQEILASPKTPEATRRAVNPFAIPVSITYMSPRANEVERWDKPLIPDAIFGIEYLSDGKKTYRFFALEADRNTEPIYRGNLHQASYLRKILQYREIAARKAHLTHFGLPNLLVLNVTTNEQHMRNILQFVGDITEGKGCTYFLFKTMPSLASLEKAPPPTPYILTAPWQRAGHPDFRIDQP